MRMKKMTKIGWALIAIAAVLFLWVGIGSFRANADSEEAEAIEQVESTEEQVDELNSELIELPVGEIAGEEQAVAPEAELALTAELPTAEVTKAVGADGRVDITGDVETAEYRGNADVTQVTASVSSTTIGAQAFADCANLQSVVLNCTGDVIIGSSAFQGCDSLISVSIKGNVTLEDGAFASCSNLTGIVINNLDSLGSRVFSGDGELETISVSGTYTTGSDGNIYKGTQLAYARPTTPSPYEIPSGTTSIAHNALIDSNVSEIRFVDDGTSAAIRGFNFGQQDGWPATRSEGYALTISCLNAGGTGLETSLDAIYPTRIGVDIYCDWDHSATPSPSDPTYSITVKENFYKKDGTTLITTNSSVLLKKAGDNIAAETYTDYSLRASDSATNPYVVSGNATITFNYVATTENPTPPPTPPAPSDYVTITVYNIFLRADGTESSRGLRCQDKYRKGQTYSYSAEAFDGYVLYNSENTSGTASTNKTVIFRYKPKDAKSGGGSSAAAPTVTPGQPIKYTIIEGADQTVPVNPGIVSMKCDGAFDKFKYVMMDGNTVDPSCYAVAEGSTVLAFTADYMKSLSQARHHVRLVYTDGYADTTLTVGNPPKTTTTVTYTINADGTVSQGHVKDKTPKTADGFDERYLLCLAILFSGIGVILYSRQKKLEILTSGRDD